MKIPLKRDTGKPEGILLYGFDLGYEDIQLPWYKHILYWIINKKLHSNTVKIGNEETICEFRYRDLKKIRYIDITRFNTPLLIKPGQPYSVKIKTDRKWLYPKHNQITLMGETINMHKDKDIILPEIMQIYDDGDD